MSIRKRQILCCGLLCLLSASTALAQPLLVPQPVNQPSFGPAQPATKPTWIGIMGQIVQPGVYEFSVRYPGLDDVIQRAGGLTTQATNNIRIVRNGVAGQMIYYQPGKNFPLADGDLLIVDGQRHAGNRTNPRVVTAGNPAPNTGLAVPAAEEATLQIGLVNVIHRPVIVKLQRQQANIPGIVAMLGQRPDLMNSVKVIPGNPHEAKQRTNGELTDVSVLVFHPAMIRQQDLPAFPPVYAQEQPQPVAPEPVQPIQPQEMPVLPPDQVTSYPPINPGLPPEPLAPGVDLQASPASNPSPLIMPIQPVPTIEPVSSLNPNPPLVMPLPVHTEPVVIRQPVTPPQPTAPVKLEPIEAQPVRTAKTKREAESSGWLGWTVATLTILVLGAVAGGAWWYLKHRPRQLAQTPAQPAATPPTLAVTPEAELLTALLKKRLPVTPEPVEVSEQIQISRLAEKVFRRDAAAIHRPPHFPVTEIPAIPVVPPVIEVPVEELPTAEVADSSVINGEQFGLLDRILSRLEGEQNS